MENIRFYASTSTERPNGTVDLLVTDSDGSPLFALDAALFGSFRPVDPFGGISVLMHGEAVGYVDLEQQGASEGLREAILDGSISDLEPVAPLSLERTLQCLAVSPVSDASMALIDALRFHGLEREADELKGILIDAA